MEQPSQLSIKDRPIGVTPASLATALTRPVMIALLCLAAVARVWSICDELPARAASWDFSIYYMSATAVRHGLNPYQTDFAPLGKSLGLEAGDIHHATDPPTFLLLIETLAAIRERTAFYIWVGLNAIFLAAALAILFGKSSGLGGRSGLALGALAVLYPPTYYHFFFAQSKIPILLALVLMMRSMEHGWDRVAGLWLAFASLLRVFPLLLIGYLAIQRRWRVLLWTFIGLGIGGLVTVSLLGLNDSLSFLQGVELLTGQRWLSLHGNIALGAAVLRLFWFIAGGETGWMIDLARRLTIAAAEVALLGATIWATVGLGRENDPDWRAFSMWIVASVLLSPTAFVHYMVLFFIPFARIVAAARRSGVSLRVQWLTILSYFLIPTSAALPLMLTSTNQANFRTQWGGWFSAAVFEPLFIAAMLMYLASYWFTVEATQMAWTPADGQKDSAGLPGVIQERC